MVVKKVMSLSRWAPPGPARRKRKCKVTVKVVGLEGLPPLPGEGRVAAVEVRWRQPHKVGALAYLMGRKKQARSVSSRRPVVEDSWAVRWDYDDEANRFENVCRLCDPESVADPVHDVSFSILYGCGDGGGKLNKLETIGTTMVNLAEWAKEYESKRKGERAGEKEFKKQLCITLKKEGLTSHGMLHVTASFTEVRPFGVMEKASPCEDKMMVECQASQQMKSDDSGSFDTEDMVLDRLILLREEEDTSEVGNHHNHTASSSNSWRSSPESESSSKSWFQWSKRRKVTNMVRDLEGETMKPSSFHQDNLSENGKKESAESDEDDDPVGHWRNKEFISRDKQTKLKVQTFFASIDQRDPSAGGESACTAIAAVIASALHDNELNTPTRSEFDALIREGSSEWQQLCNNPTYIENFPDKHFDLETILEAKIRPISVLPDKSFIGFFRPENFKSLHGAMSFDDIWHEITSDVGGDSKVYIVGWNDHFFMLKLEANAYYVMDTLGERLYEGCKKAYMLRFDDSTEMFRWHENKAIEDSEELICRGKECCREFINRFLAAIPLQEELELEEKGIGINTALHQRLQIEFQLTEASAD
ncbi:uncharacterized protein LOC135673195 isoform X1 [Musa acuminata AAA Group]|uniref:uncharacterized protein LOC103984099 isoform X1 n=1 Tax=Musa acuminata AAA Group TaxID=214697 RepID=UPI0031D8CAF9